MKRTMILFGALFSVGIAATSYAKDKGEAMEQMTHHHMMQMKEADADKRISLKLPPQMKQHQLSNMRAHLEAVEDIIGLIAEENFDKASQIAHSKLGLTERMKQMCNMFDNDDFKNMGLAFHKSGDALGDVLQTKDTAKSLRALRSTMNYCVQCHAAFRQ